MKSIQDQFSFEILENHFEKDNHIGVQDKEINNFHILHGETSTEDILIVEYKGSPHLTFYSSTGKVIDVDHYLPDYYINEDHAAAKSLLQNLRNIEPDNFKNSKFFNKILSNVFNHGKGYLHTGLKSLHGLSSSSETDLSFRKHVNFVGDETEYKTHLLSRYENFFDLFIDYILVHQRRINGYLHITKSGNIIITPLNKRCGIAVIIETKDVRRNLLPTNKWIITRTNELQKFEQSLVFRSQDVQDYFEAAGADETFETDRYKLYYRDGQVSLDSFLDNTDNLLELELINNCFQVLASDDNIILFLTNDSEVTVVNTHKSVIPSKWPRKIVLSERCRWIRADENLSTLFAQKYDGEIIVFDISSEDVKAINSLGSFEEMFLIDQDGSIICKSLDDNKLIKIRTNANELESQDDQKNFASVFKNLGHLFKGESLFVKTQFAKVVTEEKVIQSTKLPTASEIARYDFETNIEHMLIDAEDDHDKLLAVQNKIAIARQNISEELIAQAEKEGIFLGGQRLKTTVNAIVRPAERRLKDIIEKSRAEQIIKTVASYRDKISELTDPNSYREILNEVRKFDEELRVMSQSNTADIMVDFRAAQQELNTTFADQIADDDTALQQFITGEIEQIEEAIKNTHNPRQLELILSTHPAALELFTLLKQPFVLQNIAKEKSLSPAGIQTRLYEAVEKRKAEIKAEHDRNEAEKNAAKMQLANMINESIDFFVKNHSSNFSDIELNANASYQQIQSDILKLETIFRDVRLAMDLRRLLERRILERSRADLEQLISFEGKYAFIQNDPDLYIDWNAVIGGFPTWSLEIREKKGETDTYSIIFIRDTDLQTYQPSTTENLKSNKAFEIDESKYQAFLAEYQKYVDEANSYDLLLCLWLVHLGQNKPEDFPQFSKGAIKALLPDETIGIKALRCALEKKRRDHQEMNRKRDVPIISPEFIDDTPFFQEKLQEFVIKAKLQMVSGSGIILLSGPPSTGKSAFLKFISSIMNREYFEHASDKWQTKNSLVTAIKFGENGPYAIPAGFTKAITTPYSLVNIEEIKEWPEALRKSLNPFFAGSKIFIAPDGTRYKIGQNILMCAAANLGSMYRQDDEPFTADFWSRIEVVEYDYAPHNISRDYLDALHKPKKNKMLSLQDLVREYFAYNSAPDDPKAKAKYFSKQFLEFMLLPKADEKIKRDNLGNYIKSYFNEEADLRTSELNPEEAVKVAYKRIKDFQGYSIEEFFDLYDHFNNGQNLRSARLGIMQSTDVEKYEHFRILFLSIRYIEGCLRKLRTLFYSSAGQTEIEGTNREFIKCVYLLGLMGKF